jgi:hypothetical protein
MEIVTDLYHFIVDGINRGKNLFFDGLFHRDTS